MSIEFVPTPDQIDVIKRMASHGLNRDMVAKALGINERTLIRNKEIKELYNQAYTAPLEEIAKTMYEKAMAGDPKVLTLVAATRLGWTKGNKLEDEEFTGDYTQKKAAIDQALRDGRICISDYQRMVDSITKQYQVDEHDRRLTALEKIVEEKQNLGGYKQRDDL
jgi:hypothetical protein